MKRIAIFCLALLTPGCGSDEAPTPVHEIGDSRLACATAMREGRSADSIREGSDYAQALRCVALVRFGRWEAVLAEELPAAGGLAAVQFARGMAFAATGREAEAVKADEAVAGAAKAWAAGASDLDENRAGTVLGLAAMLLAGEIDARAGRIEEAVRTFTEAVATEDGLPPGAKSSWMLPVRHWLGAVLLKAGRAKEAEAVYREDLRRSHENGWALRGLVMALKAQKVDATEAELRFLKAWKKADVEITASRY